MNNPEKLTTLGTQDEGAIRNEQSRETGNTGHTRRIQTKQKHNTICVEHTIRKQTQIMYNVNKPRAFLQTTEGKNDPKTC
jgi:hypothetical protein